MALEFKDLTFTLGSSVTGTQTFDITETFGSNVTQATVAVNSFLFDYKKDDHHINVIQIDTEVIPIRNTVRVLLRALYGDKNFDDKYTGRVNLSLIVERE